MRRVFLDTVGLLATWDESDQWHGAALAAYEVLRGTRAIPYTTTYVLAECANAAARRPFRGAPTRLLAELESLGTLIRITSEDWEAAWQAYSRGEAGDAGLVDQLSFAVMRRLRVSRAFTNDRHFQAAGFEILF